MFGWDHAPWTWRRVSLQATHILTPICRNACFLSFSQGFIVTWREAWMFCIWRDSCHCSSLIDRAKRTSVQLVDVLCCCTSQKSPVSCLHICIGTLKATIRWPKGHWEVRWGDWLEELFHHNSDEICSTSEILLESWSQDVALFMWVGHSSAQWNVLITLLRYLYESAWWYFCPASELKNSWSGTLESDTTVC